MDTDPGAAMAQFGLTVTGPVHTDGKIHRFMPPGDHNDNGWYIFRLLSSGLTVGGFGSWKTGLKERFYSRERSQFTPDEWRAVNAELKAIEDIRRAEELANHERVRSRCKALFALPRLSAHPYLTAKSVKAYGAVVLSTDELTKGWLAIALQDDQGIIHSAQFIADDGTKKFYYQGRIQGTYFALSDNPAGPLVICEGYATGASIHQATGWATVCAMNCGNLLTVAKSMRNLYRDRLIIIAADNDQFTDGNPGLKKAGDAAKAINGVLAYPEFGDEALAVKPTDFNDLHQLEGLTAVREFLAAKAKASGDWMMLIEDARDTMAEVIPDPTQIVEGLVCEEAKMVIGGSSKTYKTWFTMALTLAICCGAKFLGRQCRKSRVLYVNFELKGSTFKRRLQTIAHAENLSFDYRQFIFLNLKGKIAGLTVQTLIDRLIAVARAHDVGVIVLDPLYKVNTQGKDENAAGEQTVFLNQIDRLISETHATLIFDDHFSKGNQSDKDPLDAIRGSSVKGGDVDAALIIRAHKEKGSFTVSVVHRELPPVEDFVITWNYPTFSLNDVLDPAEMKRPKGGRPRKVDLLAILAAFEDSSPESGYTLSSLSRKTGMARQTLQPYIAEFRAKSWIRTSGDGNDAFQYITDKGRALLAETQKSPNDGGEP